MQLEVYIAEVSGHNNMGKSVWSELYVSVAMYLWFHVQWSTQGLVGVLDEHCITLVLHREVADYS